MAGNDSEQRIEVTKMCPEMGRNSYLIIDGKFVDQDHETNKMFVKEGKRNKTMEINDLEVNEEDCWRQREGGWSCLRFPRYSCRYDGENKDWLVEQWKDGEWYTSLFFVKTQI